MIKAATAHDSVTRSVQPHRFHEKQRTERGQGDRRGQVHLGAVFAIRPDYGKGRPRQPGRSGDQAERQRRRPRLLSYRDVPAPRQEHSRSHREEGEDDHSGDVGDDLGRAGVPAEVGEQEAGRGSGQGPPGMMQPAQQRHRLQPVRQRVKPLCREGAAAMPGRPGQAKSRASRATSRPAAAAGAGCGSCEMLQRGGSGLDRSSAVRYTEASMVISCRRSCSAGSSE